MSIETHVHYIVQVKVKAEPKRENNRNVTPSRPAHWEWLCVDSDYPSHTTLKARAHRFEQPPTPEEIAAYSGMPWWSVHDRRVKPLIFKVTETRTQEQVKP